jgi:hypothetical protein
MVEQRKLARFWVVSGDKPLDHEDVTNQLNEICEVVAIEQEAGDATWGEVFTNSTKSRNLHRVLLGMGPYMMNQWSGISKSCEKHMPKHRCF